MQVTLEIKKGKFTNREGKQIDYFSYTAEVLGESVKFVPKETDKKLLEHLLKDCELEEVSSDSAEE